MNENNFNPNTPNFNVEASKKIAEMFPEVISDGKINFNLLKNILSPDVDNNDTKEKYEFTWRGKNNSKIIANIPEDKTTLIPDKDKSKNWDSTKNSYIEGDNLEVLKLLQKAYGESIKLIYLDPPYNTGKDFIYNDNFHDSFNNYLKSTGQIDDNGRYNTTNKETNGRFHTDWLNMMYPRLKLARNLLKDDGVIFISIDDNEVRNLRYILDEVFGESNFEGHIHWRRRKNQPNDKNKMIGLVAEHILVYSKNHNSYKKSGVGKIPLTGDFQNIDNDPKGPWNSKPWKAGSTQGGSSYSITYPNGKEVFATWMGSKETYNRLLKNNSIYFTKNGNGEPRKKIYLSERKQEGQSANNWWNFDLAGSNEQASNDLSKKYFNGKKVFSNPKPVQLIKLIISLANLKDDDIVLDFFSGSGTTAESVMDINAFQKSKYKYILVQLPENLDKAYKNTKDSKSKIIIKNAIDMLDNLGKNHNLAEVAEERIRRAGDSININYKDNVNDIGFKVYKLSKSTINQWDEDPNNFVSQLNLLRKESFTSDSTDYQRAQEISLKSGIPLDVNPIVENGVYHFISKNKELFVVLGLYDKSILDKLNMDIVKSNAAVVIRELDDGSYTKFNIIESLKQNTKLNNRFVLEWI